MGANLAELVDTGEKRDGRGRRIVAVKEREALLGAYRKSGLTQRAFAQQEGVNYYTLVEWLCRERHREPAKPDPRFRKLSVGAIVGRPAIVEVVMPGGLIVRGENAASVAELVRALQPQG
jgi:hypothetical protein